MNRLPKPNYFKFILQLPMLVIELIRLLVFNISTKITGIIELQTDKAGRVEIDPVDNDKKLKDIIEKGKSREAIEWLKESKRNSFYGFRQTKALSIINKLYSYGAEKLWIVEIEENGEGDEYSRTIVIELPEDPKKREKLFNWEFHHARSDGFDGIADCGQKYMFSYWT